MKKNKKSIVVISQPNYDRKPKYIYTITCLADLPPYCLKGISKRKYSKMMKDYHKYGGSRCFGWVSSFKQANEIVENNDCDLHEYSYKYAVIEKTADGPHAGFGQGRKEWWYKWEGSHETGAFEPIEKPEHLKCVVGWGIG